MQHTTAAVAGSFAAAYASQARAESHPDTLLTLSETGPNSLDAMGIGTSRSVYEASWNTYDRLVTHGFKKDADGNESFDYASIEPELAESLDSSDLSVTFKLRKDAKFHDGTPVTAKDVKWSFDRVVSIGGSASFQMAVGDGEAGAVRRCRRLHLSHRPASQGEIRAA